MEKVLIAQKDLKAIRSGVSRVVKSQIELFKSLGHEVHLVSEKIDRKLFEGEGTIVHKTFRWPIKGFYRRKHFDRSAQSLIRNIKPGLIVGHGNLIEQDLCFIHNCVHLASELVHGRPLDPKNDVGKFHDLVLREKKFKRLVCNSELMKNDLVSRFGVDPNKADVIYPCFDKSLFTEPDRGLRESVGIQKSTKIVGLVTSGDFKKRNVELFLRSANLLPSGFDVHFVVAGGRPGDEHLNLQQMSKYPVTFLPPTDTVSDYYNLVDIFVLPAHIEEFGLSVLESMYFAKPVIVHEKVGASEILVERSRDMILPKLSEEGLAQKILTLLESSELRDQLGHLNQETAQRYTKEHHDKKLNQIVNDLKLAKGVV